MTTLPLYFWYTAAWRTACCRQSFSLFVHVVWFAYLCRLNEQQEAFRAPLRADDEGHLYVLNIKRDKYE